MNQLEYYNRKVFPKYWHLQIGANAAVKFNIGVPFPGYVKKVIGICCYAAGVNTANTAVMAVAQADEYFISLKRQGGFPFQELRLDMLLFDQNGSAAASSDNIFFPVNFDNEDVDLQSSFILNPGAVSNALMFGFLYL